MELEAKMALGNVPITFNFEFAGGPLGQMISDISKIPGVSFNLVSFGNTAVLNTALPAFSLRNVNLPSLSRVVANLLRSRDLVMEDAGSSGPNSMIFTLTTVGKTAAARGSAEFESFQLSPYLGAQPIEEIVDAIRTAWKMNPEHDRDALRLHFHPATSILLVSGPVDGLRLAGKIISQLKRPAEPAPAPRPAAQPSAEPKKRLAPRPP